MEDKITIFSIGTIVRIEKRMAMIAGYTFREIDNHYQLYYYIIPYPKGLSSTEDCYLIEADKVGSEIIAWGYKSEQFEQLSQQIGAISELLDSVECTEITNAIIHDLEGIHNE